MARLRWSIMNATDVIEHYEAALSPVGQVVDFDVSALDRVGVAVTSCSLIVDGQFAAQANGYGLDLESARVGGLGELAEGVVMGRAMAALLGSARRGSRRELVAAEGADRVVDPRRLGLPAGSAYDDDRQLTWVPTTRVRTGETVFVPADFVVSEPGELGTDDPLITPVTNGLGAGLDRARAVSHGIGEVLQRHTNGLRFRALDRLSPAIEEAGLPGSVRALAAAMREVGVSPVFKHAGTELGVCSTYVMGHDDDDSDPIRLTGCGEAAHPSAEMSLTKALLEFANSRARKAFFFGRQPLVRQLGPQAYWSAVAARTSAGETRAREALQRWADLPVATLRAETAPLTPRTVGYEQIVVPDLPDVSTQASLRDHLLTALDGGEPGHDVLAVTATEGAVTAAKVLVTDLEVEILSYGRIGELGSRRSLADDLDLVRRQDRPSDSHPHRVHLTAEAEERLGGPLYYSYTTAERIVGDLYPLYREPPRHSVTV
jgi:ribosomal protein S12 methylthiotransferase accessory factor